jgi:CheY-like chemotaxis protein
VLEVASETLREAGFRVLSAPDGRAALRLLEEARRIDLLFSDVVMPGGLSGIELARAARRLRPELVVLLASGYPGEALAGQGGDEFTLIGKPYNRASLLQRIAALPLPARETAATEA